MPKPPDEISQLTLRQLCEVMMETEEFPTRDGIALEVARKVFGKENPMDVEVVRIGKLCAKELARRFLTQQIPRWMVVKYYRKRPEDKYFATQYFTYYKKERAEDKMSYLEAQMPFERNDVYYELVLTYDYQQDWQKIKELKKPEPKKKK